MKRRLALVCLGLLLASYATRAQAASLEKEFNFDPARFAVSERNGVTDVTYRGAIREFREGRPDLPWVGELVELPAGVRVTSVRVLSIETAALKDRALVPAAVIGKPGLGPIERSAAKPEFFSSDRPQPESPVEIGTQGWMRGKNIVGLNVSPVRWNPASGRLERVTRVRVSLVTEPIGPTAEAPVPRERIVPEWEDGLSTPFAKDAQLQHESARDPATGAPREFSATQVPSVLGSPVQYVIITNDEMAPEFQRLADWKTQSGVPTVVRTLSFIRQQYLAGSDDAERIRYFIRDAYSRWGAKWVLLGGDTEVLPARLIYSTYYVQGGEMIAADMYYSCLDGNWNSDGDHLYGEGKVGFVGGDNADLLPEVWVGRAPAINLTEAKRFVDKTLQYITQPASNYENQVLFFAEVLFPQNWSPGVVPDLDGADMAEDVLPSLRTKPWIHYARLYENYTDPAYEPGALPETRAVVKDSLNRGYNVAVHIGHGYRNVMSVGDDNLTNTDAMALTNGTKLSNLYATNCTSNAIDFPCIGEAFLHAPNGGAVTNIGSSRFDFPVAGRLFQEEYFRLLYEADVTAVGEAQGKQKIPFISGGASDGMVRWTLFTLLLLGDPELRIYTALPKTLAVSHPASMTLSATSIAVNVMVAGSPLAGARVTAYKANDEYSIGMTDVSGNVVLAVRPDNLGTLKLTVTGFNCKPYQGTINVTAATIPVLADQAVTIDDDNLSGTLGDGNGKLDAGETADLIIPLKNTGGASAPTVTGTLSTTDAMITVTAPNVNYGTIGIGATSTPAVRFRVSVPFTTPDQREVPFRLDWADSAAHSSFETIQLVVSAPEIRQFSHTFSDAGGNGNGIADPGETITMAASLRNRGTGTAYTVTVKLRSLDGLATVTDSTASYGTLAPGAENAGDALVFVPSSVAAKLELRISDSFGLLGTQTIDVVPPADPVGLAGRGFETSITLNWTKSISADLFGYNIYRSLSAVGPFVRITSIPTERTAYYLDAGLTPLTAYYYEVSAVDSSGNETARSAAVPVRTTPPNHAIFPIPMGQNTPSSVALDPIYPGYAMDILVGSDVLYLWHPDGSAPVDADGGGATSGDFTTRGHYYAAGPSIADLDGDNFKEIIGPNWDPTDSARVFVFDRDGQVMPGWPVAVNDSIWGSAAIGDVDNDGKKEMFFATFGHELYGLRWNGTEVRNGDSNPSTQGIFKVLPSDYNFGTPALADLDKDGKLDIIFGSFDARLEAWRFDGTNVPGFPIVFSGQTITASAAVGYLDGPSDVDLDVIIATGSYTWPGSTDSLYAFRSNGQRRWAVPAIGSKSSHSTSPALADMNNDGFVDVVYASTDGKIYVYDRNGAQVPPVSGARYSAITLGASESSPVVADIDGDGFEDVVMGDDLGSLTAFSGSTGTLLPGFPIQLSAEVKGTPGLCDCDNDGLSEIVVAGWDRNLYMWDYDFPFSPGQTPSWPQFHHDAMRTGLATNRPFQTGVEDPQSGPAPSAIEFAAPSPNPAATRTRVWYAVPSERAGAQFEIAVYDLSGRRVQRVASGAAKAGRHSVEWNLRGENGAPVGAGVYFMKLNLGSETRSQKLVVLH